MARTFNGRPSLADSLTRALAETIHDGMQAVSRVERGAVARGDKKRIKRGLQATEVVVRYLAKGAAPVVETCGEAVRAEVA